MNKMAILNALKLRKGSIGMQIAALGGFHGETLN
jgi:hypothetical protein